MLGLDLLVGSRAHFPLHLGTHLKEKGTQLLPAADILNPHSCARVLVGAGSAQTVKLNRHYFLQKQGDSLCSLVPPGGSCWLWIKSMRGNSGLPETSGQLTVSGSVPSSQPNLKKLSWENWGLSSLLPLLPCFPRCSGQGFPFHLPPCTLLEAPVAILKFFFHGVYRTDLGPRNMALL